MSFSNRSYYFAGAIAVAGIAGQWLGGVYTPLWRILLVIFIFCVLLEYLLIRRQQVSVTHQISGRALLGRKIRGTLFAVNHQQFPVSLQVEFQSVAAFANAGFFRMFRLEPGKKAGYSYELLPVEPGDYVAGRTFLRMLGRSGLIWWRLPDGPQNKIRIVPDSVQLSDKSAGLQRSGNRRFRFKTGNEQGTELIMLRDYQYSDPMHLIDWKATARSGSAKVRVFTSEQQIELVILIDCGRGSLLQAGRLSRMNHYINVAARLAETALAAGDRVGLVSFADAPLATTPIGKGRAALLAVRDHLQRTHAVTRESNPLFAVMHLRRLLRHRGLIVFLTEIAEAEAASQLLRAMQLLMPKHIPLVAAVKDETIEGMKRLAGDDWLDPYRRYAAYEYTHAVRRSVLNLEKSGCTVVLAGPDELDREVMLNYDRLRNQRRV